jgi:hypothetical protein
LDQYELRQVAINVTNKNVVNAMFDKHLDTLKTVTNISSWATINNSYFLSKAIYHKLLPEDDVKSLFEMYIKNSYVTDVKFVLSLIEDSGIEDYVKDYYEKNPGTTFLSIYYDDMKRFRDSIIKKYPSDIATVINVANPLSIKYLIQKGVPKDELSEALLYVPVSERNPSPALLIIDLLLDAGADINYQDENGETALSNIKSQSTMSVYRDGYGSLIRYLKSKGAGTSKIGKKND